MLFTAVSTTREESATEAARLTGARPYTSAHELAADPEVDLVVVTVKVSAHRELVGAALSAGKHVLCEWPLGADAAEAISMVNATGPDRRGFVGLQARMDPAAAALRELIHAGKLGEIQAVSARSSRAKGSGELPAAMAYTRSSQRRRCP
jgi:predicted dehydrogenase